MFKRIPRVVSIYLISLTIMIGLFMVKYNDLPLQVPLFYSLPESESQIVPMLYLLWIPVIEGLLLICNGAVRALWFRESHLANDIITWTDYTVCIGFTYVFIKIVTLVS